MKSRIRKCPIGDHAGIYFSVAFAARSSLIRLATNPSYLLRLLAFVVNFVIACSNESLVLLDSNDREGQKNILRSRELIYGGQDAKSGRYPYFVRLVGTGQCGGALIAPEVVITAAHCK